MTFPVTGASGAAASIWSQGRTLIHESGKYLLASVVALAVDFGLLVFLTHAMGVHYLVSAAVGFSAGLLVNYALSVTLVFSQRRLRSRRLEFLGFFVIGLLGLLLNEALMTMFVEVFGFAVALAKIPSTAIGFVLNFVSRRALLFSAPPA